jgi:hypothetical protein
MIFIKRFQGVKGKKKICSSFVIRQSLIVNRHSPFFLFIRKIWEFFPLLYNHFEVIIVQTTTYISIKKS